MDDTTAKGILHHYLQQGREALLWKLDGMSEYDARRPLTPTGTNVLGLVKHLAYIEMGYFGPTFGRPVPEVEPWLADDVEVNADMWATAEESRADVVATYHRAWAITDVTVEELPLDAPGTVSWWSPENRDTSLLRVLVHVVAETHRHAGHADIVRELLDGAVGRRPDDPSIPGIDWAAYRDRLEAAARQAGSEASGR
jgi:hypothetical protein